MWTSCTIKDELLDSKIDFCMLAIKPKFCGWLFHAWTQICERKETICKGGESYVYFGTSSHIFGSKH